MDKTTFSPETETAAHADVTTLGGFKLQLGGAVINESINRSYKLWNLLAYLVVFRSRNIPQSELIDLFWADEGSSNPAGALKTLLCRTRALLTPIIGKDITLILSQRGSYSWNHAISCTVDAEEFEKASRRGADASLPLEERLAAYRTAVSLYKGDFLPKLADQLWVIPLSEHYHSLYLETVKSFSSLLLQQECYDEMAGVCRRALQIDNFDETLHALLITALLRQGKNTAALTHYEQTTDMLYRNLGVQPSEELSKLYQEIMREQKSLELDLGVIQQSLQETAERKGAFVCDFGFFKEAYRLEARRAARQGNCVHIALLTVSMADGTTPGLDLLNPTMDQLLQVLVSCLRRGDIISRYSPAQYVLMLPTANFEDGTLVMERILAAFSKQHRKKYIKVNYKLRQLELPA
jgi:DNA-binding SARP family transcriptional activator